MNILQNIIALPRFFKRIISVSFDFTGLALLSVFAIWLRLGNTALPNEKYYAAIAILPLISIPIFIKQGLYRAIVRHIGYRFNLRIFITVTSAILLWAAVLFISKLDFPRTAIIITWLLSLLYISGTRILARWVLTEGSFKRNYSQRKKVIILGAGSSGQQLLHAINKLNNIHVFGFIDDDKNLINQEIESVRVYSRDKLKTLIESFNVQEIFLAIPSAKGAVRKRILEWLEPYPIKVSTLPSIDKIVDGKVNFSDIREVGISDLLGREPIVPKEELLSKCITDKVVMITGAGGSIGSEICRVVAKQQPKCIILYELSEYALYQIEHELSKIINNSTRIIHLLGDVQNKDKTQKIIRLYKVDTIYHAAAYKHVPIVEHNIAEGIYNNTIGTLNTALAAAEEKVKYFVLISTDKAVRPTNVMGATKRMAEIALQGLQDKYIDTKFVMVRFGNVLGSSGSVIPLFRKQIASGGPVTVTHKEITRYFMTISEATSLVIQAGAMGEGGEVFVLDMGEPVKIDQLARRLIHLSGLDAIDENGNGSIEIKYTGLRPGEKLFEELLIGDNVDGTHHPRIMKAQEEYLPFDEFTSLLNEVLDNIKNDDYITVKKNLKKIVSGYQSETEIVDFVYERSARQTTGQVKIFEKKT